MCQTFLPNTIFNLLRKKRVSWKDHIQKKVNLILKNTNRFFQNNVSFVLQSSSLQNKKTMLIHNLVKEHVAIYKYLFLTSYYETFSILIKF